jgi:hypothetical protein
MSAFGLTEPGVASDNRFFIALAALELMADAAAERPVFVGVDDLVWVDDASREAIEFISRRITDEQIVMLPTCRLNQPPESTFGSLLLWLDALDIEASRELLHHQAPNLSAGDEARVLEAAAGNPLALLELAKVVGRAAESSVFASIPLTQRLERSFAAGLDDLDPSVRMALLVAAIQDSDQLSETYAALAELTGDHDAKVDLHKAAQLGMLIIEGDTFRFRHPLVRSAIAQSAYADERRAVHQAFAATLGADPDRAVWHRALAAPGAQESLAAELDAGADRAVARGAPGLAEEWLRRAANLSEDDRHRGHRLLRAAELAFELGRHETVSELMSEARTLTLDPSDYARLAGLEGAFDDGIPGDEDNIGRLVKAADRARRDSEEGLAASLLLGACNSCYWGAAGEDLRSRVRAGIEALSLDSSDPRVMVLYSEIDPFARGTRLVDQLTRWASREITDVALLGLLARTGFITGDFERGLGFAMRASDLLRQQGRIALLTQTRVLEAFASLYLGRWDITLVACDEAFRFGFETRQPLWAAIAPFPAASMTGSAARVVRTAAIRLRVSVACQSSSVIPPNPPGLAGAAPTLLTRMSIRSPAATSLAGPPGSARSTSTTRTRPARASSSSSAEDFSVPAVTCAPSATSPRVIASPIPRLAPVTIAVCPFRRRSMMSLSSASNPGPAVRRRARCPGGTRSVLGSRTDPGASGSR